MPGAIAKDNVTTDTVVFPGTAVWVGLEASRLAREVVMSAFWTRDRDTNAESENAAAAGARAGSWRLTAMGRCDRCDRCGAQAYVRVLLPGHLELLFCAHHNRQYSSALANIAVEIQDETIRLACCALCEALAVTQACSNSTEPDIRASAQQRGDGYAALRQPSPGP